MDDLPTPLTTTYKETNGSIITTDIYLPPPSQQNDRTHYPVLITIHGGAFMLGHSKLISPLQVSDCLDRNWIVASPNHRLCPGVNLRDGPLRDIRDFLAWVYDGNGLDAFLVTLDGGDGDGDGDVDGKRGGRYRVDKEKVMAFGTSSGGFLALGLGFDTPRPPCAILNFYGAVHFAHPSWKKPLPHVQSILPSDGFKPGFLESVYDEYPIPTSSGISLEGQSQSQAQSNKPDFTRARDAFALSNIANGNVLNAIFPPSAGDILSIDPVNRIEKGFPPTFIVHGDSDRMVSVDVSRRLFEVLQEKGVESGILEVAGEDHTFALGMEGGSAAWRESVRGFEWLESIISRNKE